MCTCTYTVYRECVFLSYQAITQPRDSSSHPTCNLHASPLIHDLMRLYKQRVMNIKSLIENMCMGKCMAVVGDIMESFRTVWELSHSRFAGWKGRWRKWRWCWLCWLRFADLREMECVVYGLWLWSVRVMAQLNDNR